jgi:NagD protein
MQALCPGGKEENVCFGDALRRPVKTTGAMLYDASTPEAHTAQQPGARRSRLAKHFICDMDGVLVLGSRVVPGANEFLQRLKEAGSRFLLLTNNSLYTQRDLQVRLKRIGLDVPQDAIYTSAVATAQFLATQHPGGSAYVVGEAGLTTALHGVGFVITDQKPDYVVLGETFSYSFERITQAMRLVAAGARFIATNPDVAGPGEGGMVPATGAVAALISAATGVQPYYIGKPNPLIMRTALRTIGAHSEESVMVGDRMDTDIIIGTESGLETILVLTGVTRREDIARYPYRPTRVYESVADIELEP